MEIRVIVINKPAPHCPITFGHPCYRGYVPSHKTDIKRTWMLADTPYDSDWGSYPDNRNDL